MTRWYLLPLCALGLLCSFTSSGCRMLADAPALPKEGPFIRDQLVIYADFPLPQRHRLIDELSSLRTDLAAKLRLPVVDEPIYVYLFESAEEYRAYMEGRFPSMADRRAFFAETDTRLIVYAHWGDRVAEDLRHETTHGYLHATVPELPLWLDEGLAEYYETPRVHRGMHLEHLHALMSAVDAGTWRPDWNRMQSLHEADAMTQLDYAECWAWTSYLLEGTGGSPSRLPDYLVVLSKSEGEVDAGKILGVDPKQGAEFMLQYLKQLAEREAKTTQ